MISSLEGVVANTNFSPNRETTPNGYLSNTENGIQINTYYKRF